MTDSVSSRVDLVAGGERVSRPPAEKIVLRTRRVMSVVSPFVGAARQELPAGDFLRFSPMHFYSAQRCTFALPLTIWS